MAFNFAWALTRRIGRWSRFGTFSAVLLVACGGSGDSSPPVSVDGCTPGADIRVLFVGNSQIEVRDMPRIVQTLSESAPTSCRRIRTGTVTRGGANLRDHWNEGRALSAIRSGLWDVVVLAESIDIVFPLDARYPGDFTVYGQRFIQAAQQAGVRPILFATPSSNSAQRVQEFQKMAEPQIALGRSMGVSVATGGLAWLRVWERLPTIVLHDNDNAHPNYLGSTLSGYVIYASVLQRSPGGLTLAPQSDCTPQCPVIDARVGNEMQAAALAEFQAYGRR